MCAAGPLSWNHTGLHRRAPTNIFGYSQAVKIVGVGDPGRGERQSFESLYAPVLLRTRSARPCGPCGTLCKRDVSLCPIQHRAIRHEPCMALRAAQSSKLEDTFLPDDILEIGQDALSRRMNHRSAIKALHIGFDFGCNRAKARGRVEDQFPRAAPILFTAELIRIENNLRLFLTQAVQISGRLFTGKINRIPTVYGTYFQSVILVGREVTGRTVRLR